jgi:thiamine-monophosphate kinase
LEFEPRLEEGRWLAEHFAIHAMIDLSDGLAGDLRRMMERSQVGAELLARSIPISRAARRRARSGASAKAPLAAALTDGEDYELLFAVASREAVPLADAWRKQFSNLRLSCIGKITAAPGLRLIDESGAHSFEGHGYVHFA